MLIFRTAIKNILGGGRRTWLNVAVLSFVFVLMVGYNGIMDGWLQDTKRDSQEWETGYGQFWHPNYDRYDVFTLQDAHGKIPDDFQQYINDKTLTPVLIIQATSYKDGRMQNILLKGIDTEQNILHIPVNQLKQDNGETNVIIGKRMAQSAKLKEGDRIMVRWRDRNGAFDAKEVVVAGIFDTKTSTVDAGQMWMALNDLQEMTGMENEATYLVRSESNPLQSDTDGWSYKNLKFLMYDLDLMVESQAMESIIIFGILLAIALLAVFDTQTLSIFRRQKEIGTYIALGMTPRRVINLFTLEGTSYSFLAVLVSFVWGTPVLYWLSKTGMPMPESFDEFGYGMGSTLYPSYEFSTIMTSIIIIVVLSALISYLPARKIAKKNVVDALKGKVS